MDYTSILDGTGTEADYLAQYGDQGNAYIQNQTAVDKLDSGTAGATGNGSTSATPPSWMTGLYGLLGATAPVIAAIAPVLKGQQNPAQNPGALPTPEQVRATTAQNSLTKLYVIGGVIIAAIIGAVVFFSRRKPA